jgi:hypothetical protein
VSSAALSIAMGLLPCWIGFPLLSDAGTMLLECSPH